MRLARYSLTQMMKLVRWSFGLLLALLSSLKFWFSPCEGDVSKPYHVLYLSLHCNTEEGYEVHDEDRPEHGDVEELEEGTEESNGSCLCGRVPELKLGQPSDKRSKLLILRSWKHIRTIFVSLQLRHSRIYFRSEKCKQQIEMVDCQGIGDYVPTLCYEDPGHKGADKDDGRHPPAGGEGGPSVQHQLVSLSQSLEECDHHVRPLPQHVLASVLHHLAFKWKSRNKNTRENCSDLQSTVHFYPNLL